MSEFTVLKPWTCSPSCKVQATKCVKGQSSWSVKVHYKVQAYIAIAK